MVHTKYDLDPTNSGVLNYLGYNMFKSGMLCCFCLDQDCNNFAPLQSQGLEFISVTLYQDSTKSYAILYPYNCYRCNRGLPLLCHLELYMLHPTNSGL